MTFGVRVVGMTRVVNMTRRAEKPAPIHSPPLAECLPEAPRFLGSAGAAAGQAPESHPSTGKAACVGAFEPALSPAGVVLGALVQEFGLQLRGESQALRNGTGYLACPWEEEEQKEVSSSNLACTQP